MLTVEILSVMQILIGAALMLASIYVGLQIRKNIPLYLRKKWLIIIYFMCFFLAGYIFSVIIILSNLAFPIELVTGSVFLGGAFFVYMIIKLSRTSLQKIAEDELKFRMLFQNTNDAIFITYKDILVDCNGQALKMFGCERDDITRYSLYEFSPEKQSDGRLSREKAAEKINAALDGHFQFFEWRFIKKTRTLFDAEVSLNSLKIDRETLLQIIIRDITERKLAEDEKRKLQLQLLQSQKLESVGRLAGGLAHDFNNLLSAILGYSEMSLEEMPDDNPLKENIRIINEAGEKAAALTWQLLAFSRKQVLTIKVVNLNAIIENMGKMLAIIGEDILMELNTGSPVRNVMADPVQLEQILMNLVINARDAMPCGGRLIIETADIDLDEEYAKSHEGLTPGSYVMLSITDDGEGMSREVQERIFEPFFTTKDTGRGTGLGLSIVYGIVKQHKGYIWSYSESGKGTSFNIYLPAAEGEVEEVPEKEQVTLVRGTETVLVVDDEPSIRKLILDMLQPLGYQLLEASCGEEALQISDTFKDKIDLVLTDVIMPGMNGRELADAFKSRRPKAKVIFMSGYTDNTIARHGVLEPGMAFFPKPLTRSRLADKLREVLDR